MLKTRTLRLAELMEDDDVMRVVEVFGQSLDVLPAQSVGHKESSSVSIRPVDTILEHRPKKNSRVYFNKDKLAAVFLTAWVAAALYSVSQLKKNFYLMAFKKGLNISSYSMFIWQSQRHSSCTDLICASPWSHFQ